MRNHHSSKSGFQEPLNKKARVTPSCAGDCPCALSVSASTGWLGQDHRGRVCAMQRQGQRAETVC